MLPYTVNRHRMLAEIADQDNEVALNVPEYKSVTRHWRPLRLGGPKASLPFTRYESRAINELFDHWTVLGSSALLELEPGSGIPGNPDPLRLQLTPLGQNVLARWNTHKPLTNS
jgi:hypothetical protein